MSHGIHKATVMSCLHPFVIPDKAYDSRKLVTVGRSCFQKFLHRLPAMFSTIPSCDPHWGLRDRGSTVRRLDCGLQSVVGGDTQRAQTYRTTSQVKHIIIPEKFPNTLPLERSCNKSLHLNDDLSFITLRP